MRLFFDRKKKSAGFSMIEFLAWTALAGLAAAGVMAYKSKGNTTATANQMVAAMSNLQQNLTTFMAPSGYNGLTAQTVNQMGLAVAPLTVSGSGASTVINDAWGNAMTFTGNAAGATGTYVITIGGTTTPLSTEACVAIVNGLVNSADDVNVGASTAVTTTSGLVGGGTTVKSASTSYSAASAATGCAATNPVIGFQFH